MIKFDKKLLCKIGFHDEVELIDGYTIEVVKRPSFMRPYYVYIRNKVCIRCGRVLDNIKKYHDKKEKIDKEKIRESIISKHKYQKAEEIYNKYKAENDG